VNDISQIYFLIKFKNNQRKSITYENNRGSDSLLLDIPNAHFSSALEADPNIMLIFNSLIVKDEEGSLQRPFNLQLKL
jgi:lipoprotein NlpI